METEKKIWYSLQWFCFGYGLACVTGKPWLYGFMINLGILFMWCNLSVHDKVMRYVALALFACLSLLAVIFK